MVVSFARALPLRGIVSYHRIPPGSVPSYSRNQPSLCTTDSPPCARRQRTRLSRRQKNREAARRCRKRKTDMLTGLEEDLGVALRVRGGRVQLAPLKGGVCKGGGAALVVVLDAGGPSPTRRLRAAIVRRRASQGVGQHSSGLAASSSSWVNVLSRCVCSLVPPDRATHTPLFLLPHLSQEYAVLEQQVSRCRTPLAKCPSTWARIVHT